MNITFIRPNMNTSQSADAMEPIVFGLLAALTPPHIDITLLDERIEPLALHDSPDLVALTVETFTARRAYQISEHYRNQGIPVVMGGFHPSLLPTEAAQFADALIIGDAEELWPQLLHDFQSGRLQPIYQQSTPPPLTNYKWDYSIFRNNKYCKIKPVQTGRGCKYGCDFCSINGLYGNSIRQRPVSEVAKDIEALGAKYIFLVDDNLFSNRSRTKALLKALIPLNIRWVCQCSMEISRDTVLMGLLAQSGCVAAIIGFESLNRDNLRLMNKKNHNAILNRFLEIHICPEIKDSNT